MRLGAFLMPTHPPEEGIRDGQLCDLHQLELLDSLGFEEAWIGEHFTAIWEPCPAPDLLDGYGPEGHQTVWTSVAERFLKPAGTRYRQGVDWMWWGISGVAQSGDSVLVPGEKHGSRQE